MRIALVTETYPPEVNGVATTLSRLVSGLAGRDHVLQVVRPRQKGEGWSHPRMHNVLDGVEQLLVSGWPIAFYNSLRVGFPAVGKLTRRWRKERPDVVHVATEGPLGFAALVAARRLSLPVSSSFHTNFHHYSGHYGLQVGRGLALRYLRWFHNGARCTLVPTDEMRTALAEQKFERLGVLSRGVDAKLFSPARRSDSLRAQWGVGPDDPVVIHVGRMAAEKNLELAVEAFLAMRAINPRARFVLVGDGPQRVAQSQKYPEFVYAGVRRGEDLAAHYASADLFVFPSITETFGNVLTEALASGLVVLAYDYAAARQHVRLGVNGFVANFDDRQDFLRVAGEVITRRREWPALRNAARATAQTISWESIVVQFETELRKVAGR